MSSNHLNNVKTHSEEYWRKFIEPPTDAADSGSFPGVPSTPTMFTMTFDVFDNPNGRAELVSKFLDAIPPGVEVIHHQHQIIIRTISGR